MSELAVLLVGTILVWPILVIVIIALFGEDERRPR